MALWSVGELVTAAKLNKLGGYLLWDSVDAGTSLPAASISTATLDTTSFAHLLVHCSGMSSAAVANSDYLAVRCNADAGSNYGYQRLYAANNTTLTAGSNWATSYALGFSVTAASAGLAGSRGGGMILIPGYTAALDYKKVIGLGGTFWNNTATSGQLDISLGVYIGSSGDAISSLTFLMNSGSDISAGRMSVYGIPG